MAETKPDQLRTERHRETIAEFEARFGDLSARFEKSENPELAEEQLPTAEHPQDIAVREQDNQPQQEPHHTWPDLSSQNEFQHAANDSQSPEQKPLEGQGEGSQMVKDDAPRYEVKPPENTEDQDRSTHQERMRGDDMKAKDKDALKAQIYEQIDKKLELRKLQNEAQQDHGQDKNQGQDYSR